MRKIKVLLFLALLGILLTYAYSDVEINFIYGITKPNLGDLEYLYSAQNDELNNLKNQGFTAKTDYNFSSPDYFRNFGGEIKFSISSSLWLGIEYTKTKLNHVQGDNWVFEKSEAGILESISGNIDNFSTDYDINIFGLNLYWKFPLSSLLELEAGVGVSYIKLKDDNNYTVTINSNITFGEEYVNNEIKISQAWDLESNTFGGKAGLRLNVNIKKSTGLFLGVYYSYYSPKELSGNFRYTTTSKYTSSFDSTEHSNSATYLGNGVYHIIVREGSGSNMTYMRPIFNPSPPGDETDQGIAKTNFSGTKAVIGVFFRF